MLEDGEDTNTIFERLDFLERKFKLLEHFTDFRNVNFIDLFQIRGFKEFSFKEPFIFKREEIFQILSRYYVRRFLSDIYSLKKLTYDEVKNFLSKWKIDKLTFEKLIDSDILIRESDSFLVNPSFDDFEILIESFISLFLKEKFGIDSVLNVKVKELEKGGDIDIIGKWKLELLMIELKESPPNNISLSDLRTTFERFRSVKPDLFIFAIDTTLSIKRNIIDNINNLYGVNTLRIREGIYKVFEKAFVVTAKRNLLFNLGYVVEKNFL